MPDDIIVPSPLYPVINPAWLYVPRGSIVLPVGEPPSNQYILAENEDDLALEDASGFLQLESASELRV